MTDHIKLAKLRLGRAWKHIQEFKMKTDAFFNSKPYRIVAEEEPKGNTKILRYRFKVDREPPLELRLIIGDCIHSLRAIPDNLVWGLGQISGEPSSSSLDFEVYLSEFSRSSKDRAFDNIYAPKLRKLPADAQALIRRLQPFNTNQGAQSGTAHPLYILNRLANQDKHDMPIEVCGIQQHTGLGIRRLTIVGPGNLTLGQSLEDGTVFLELPVPANQSPTDLEPKVTVGIAFDKNGPAAGRDVHQFLVSLHNFIRDEAVAKFEPFFPT